MLPRDAMVHFTAHFYVGLMLFGAVCWCGCVVIIIVIVAVVVDVIRQNALAKHES